MRPLCACPRNKQDCWRCWRHEKRNAWRIANIFSDISKCIKYILSRRYLRHIRRTAVSLWKFYLIPHSHKLKNSNDECIVTRWCHIIYQKFIRQHEFSVSRGWRYYVMVCNDLAYTDLLALLLLKIVCIQQTLNVLTNHTVKFLISAVPLEESYPCSQGLPQCC